jgi:hypothetical protein
VNWHGSTVSPKEKIVDSWFWFGSWCTSVRVGRVMTKLSIKLHQAHTTTVVSGGCHRTALEVDTFGVVPCGMWHVYEVHLHDKGNHAILLFRLSCLSLVPQIQVLPVNAPVALVWRASLRRIKVASPQRKLRDDQRCVHPH